MACWSWVEDSARGRAWGRRECREHAFARGERGYCLRIGLGFFAPFRMTVRGTRPRSFPWRREPTPPLDARPRIKCGAGCTGMTVEARGKEGVAGASISC